MGHWLSSSLPSPPAAGKILAKPPPPYLIGLGHLSFLPSLKPQLTDFLNKGVLGVWKTEQSLIGGHPHPRKTSCA